MKKIILAILILLLFLIVVDIVVIIERRYMKNEDEDYKKFLKTSSKSDSISAKKIDSLMKAMKKSDAEAKSNNSID